VQLVHAHSLEAWTIAWSTKAGTDELPRLYSGGDDSALSVHDAPSILHMGTLDTEPATETVYEPMSRDAKTHGAGVTAILPLTMESATDRETLLTGSYDEFLRVLLPKMPGRRTGILAEKRLYGGVWRLKLLNSSQTALNGGKKFKILVSCMHAGAKVVEVSCSAEEKWAIETLANFEEHESMNYASDSQEEINGDNVKSKTYISTSFYDKRLCAWELTDN
jgi:diphthine methyl ester acylhydrolase